MEQWVMLAQGSMYTLMEEFYLDSDSREMYICKNCNEFAIYNSDRGKYKCKTCKEDVDICKVDGSKTAQWFLQQLQMANIKVKVVS